MADFGIRFFLCNILICAVIGIFLTAKQALRKHLTSRMQFNLWFLLLGLLAVPFIPIRPIPFSQIFSLLDKWKNAAPANIETMTETALNVSASGTARQMNDFALSVSSKTPSVIGLMLLGIWLMGIFAMLLLIMKSKARLNNLKKSALPLQSREVRMLYDNCLSELKIKRDIPIYSTAFLKSPIIVGLFRPCIYLPIHLISGFHVNAERHKGILEEGFHMTAEECFNATDLRYMLLHELQHYKHKDAVASYLMNFFGILYWFNPLVWYALKEMRNDREVACDTSVLKLLNEGDYEDYGRTLINFAEKVSLTPFPFAAGISGTMKQMQKRIINISSYQKPSALKKIKGVGIFAITSVIFLGLTPMLSIYAAEQSYYKWNVSPEKIDLIDLSAYFNGYEGSFVLYDLKDDIWSIYDMDHATLRTAPNSTYKIYDALFGLEEGIITPKNSFIAWNGADYPFEAWNADQNLYSAMQSSVNWYFQEIDAKLGTSALRSYIKKIGYGNENINSDLSSYWMQSALKISPVEQVELLTDLYNNDFGFTPENVNAVKDSICLFPSPFPNGMKGYPEGVSSPLPNGMEGYPEGVPSPLPNGMEGYPEGVPSPLPNGMEGYPQGISSENISFYGKTGTGRINDYDINGWFIGYIETADSAYFFATNIQSTENATGSNASEISFSILSDMGIWKE